MCRVVHLRTSDRRRRPRAREARLTEAMLSARLSIYVSYSHRLAEMPSQEYKTRRQENRTKGVKGRASGSHAG